MPPPQRSLAFEVCLFFRLLHVGRHIVQGAKLIDLIRLHLLDDLDQLVAVGEVASVKRELRGLGLLNILVEVL